MQCSPPEPVTLTTASRAQTTVSTSSFGVTAGLVATTSANSLQLSQPSASSSKDMVSGTAPKKEVLVTLWKFGYISRNRKMAYNYNVARSFM